jgi:hypothetical protein
METAAPHDRMDGDVAARIARHRTLPPGLEVPWQRSFPVRLLAGALTFAAFLSPWFVLSRDWVLHIPVDGPGSLELTRGAVPALMALVLVPFLGQASYRKRDSFLITLVPVYGYLVAGMVVSRLIARPRRDWPPRPDELDRVVRIPGAGGDYLLMDTFSVAEELRTRWCVNPEHRHPYESWELAQQLFCHRLHGLTDDDREAVRRKP